MRLGIIGAGVIAGVMAKTVTLMQKNGEDVSLYAIASRTQEKADAFARQWGFEKAYGSYEALAADENVDLVYIATPHSHHAEQIKLCLTHGRAVLCEKAFTANAAQAEECFALAKEKNILLTEAIWTRYMPSRRIIYDLIAEGVIGDVHMVTSSLCYPIQSKERMVDPALAGGALLDLGVYTINFASMVMGADVQGVYSHAELTDRGVDHTENITLVYPGGKTAHLSSSFMARSDRRCCIMGSKGYITTSNVNNPLVIEVRDTKDELIRHIDVPQQLTGYEYEVRACMKALEEGRIECEEMPHEESIRVMKVMDGLRKDWGVRFPFE